MFQMGNYSEFEISLTWVHTSCMYTHTELLKTKAIGSCCQLITIHNQLMTSKKKINDLGGWFVLFLGFFLVEREVDSLIVLLRVGALALTSKDQVNHSGCLLTTQRTNWLRLFGPTVLLPLDKILYSMQQWEEPVLWNQGAEVEGRESEQPWVKIPALRLINCVNLGSHHDTSEPQWSLCKLRIKHLLLLCEVIVVYLV